ncbi:hypothetical protein [Hellea balneolensis]|uniref:hypothetical protein n=1 Tax=Hellea balneolensis TaxID=287478 RepID=UPI00040D5A9A|nr:hypothetical protein [Hellea balneolensis]
MKTFVNTLLGTLIAGLILYVFQDRLAEWISPESSPLKAEMFVGTWHDFPDKAYGSDDYYVLKNFMSSSDTQNDFAAIKLSNDGNAIAKETRFNFEHSTYGIIKNGEETIKFQDVKFVELPNLSPGDTMNLYLWSIYGFSEYRELQSFSSMGPYKIRRHYHKAEHGAYNLAWLSTILDYGGVILLIVLGIMVFLFWLINDYFQKAIRQILIDDDIYLEEKIRLDENSGKYVLDTDKIDSYQKRIK